MGCIAIAGYSKGCDQSWGGIKKIALFERAAFLSGATFMATGITSGIVTNLGMSIFYSGYTYEFLKDNSNWTQPIVGDGQISSVHWTPNINLVFRKMSSTLRNEIYELSKGDIVAIILDFNGTYWLVGADRGLYLTASAGSSSGSKLEELNGETILIIGSESYPAPTITMSTVTDTRIKNLFL